MTSPSSFTEKPPRWRRFWRIHLPILAGLTLWLALVRVCPIDWLFGVPCPGCGMSRALLCALRLDFAGAFHYHPLFWIVPPAVLYFAHRSAWHLPGGRRTCTVLIALLAAAFIGVYLYRLLWQPDAAIGLHLTDGALYRLFS